ncbi:hypoxia-inducible factor 1-alpha inhibitor-like [Thrips palmi]|uniref:Hypoxia-inducible factor 1-alpha inhibitor-like n=1 Tax=Thrips palmi TaxID=161013 RepID=A0A6P8Z640_THRPL|nr:hypoxia-inducible factor 1-alpha inhibitor-like [Thrips palmi]
MTTEKPNWNQHDLRKYDFPLDDIPRLNCMDPQVDELIRLKKPVVLTGSNLVGAASKWNLDYLEENMGNGDFTIFVSDRNQFKFFDEKKLAEIASVTGAHVKDRSKKEYERPAKSTTMKIREFARRVKEWKDGDERMYLQQALNSTSGAGVVQDFIRFRWDWVTVKQKLHNWGKLTYNLLLIGLEGNVTPCHYDEQENLFAQIHGHKRCILFPPEQFECLYPHPVWHPHDRQSQVDLTDIDYSRFPKAQNLHGVETVVGPGDVLYIPIYWWHHIESVKPEKYSVSLNFWYKAGPVGQVEYPIKGYQKVAIMRNVEKMLAEAMQDPEEVGTLLRTMVNGRF